MIPNPASAAAFEPAAAVTVIAECGLCHDGSMTRARQMIRAAAAAGVPAIKFQKRSAPHWFTNRELRGGPRMHFGRTVGAHRAALELLVDQHVELRDLAHSLGLQYGLSVWDIDAATEAVHDIRPDWFKIGRPLLRQPHGHDLLASLAASVGAPRVHVSCRDAAEIREARAAAPGCVIYYCPGRYPDDDADVQAATRVRRLGAAGISLHTRARHHALEAATAGARFIEYHLALPDTLHSDAHYALRPGEFAQLIEDLQALDDPHAPSSSSPSRSPRSC